MSNNSAIGVFDSGVGGLTVLKEIIRILPNENTIYFGDTARFPYGPRELGQVRYFVDKIINFLNSKDVKMIVIACNTSTAAALNKLQNEFDIPVIGVIEPGARTAVQNTVNGKVGVIATQGTVDSMAYENEIKKIDPGIRTISVAAPLLVEYIESGILKGKELNDIICNYLKPLIEEKIDVLLLGCTHFPLIINRILSCSGNGMKVISSATETAKDVKKVLYEKNIAADRNNKAKRIFYETGNSTHFFEVSKMFLGEEISEVITTILNM